MTADDLLERIVACGLISAASLEGFVAKAPSEARSSGEALANWLVDERVISVFQSRRLLAGVAGGLVHPPYEIYSLLGRGGMGAVYLAWDHDRQRPAAIKMMSADESKRERNNLRFQREIDVNRRLEHPKLANGYEAGLWGKTPFLAMEYVPGPTVYLLVRRNGPLDVAWSCLWIADVADALDYVHQGGVIHRDLKPSNIIITPERTAKLLDLGLARLYHDDHNEERVLGGKRKIVGSFDYIAPEQATNSARADARSDIYSLGCVAYFMLTGHPPFHHVSERLQKIECHKRVAPTPIVSVRPSCPVGLGKVIHRMMEKDPADRFPIAAEVRDALRDWADRLTEGSLPPELPAAWFGDIPLPLVRWQPKSMNQANDRGLFGLIGSGLQRLINRRNRS